ncbi:MAG: hypothetical protein K2Y21_04000 [Phycisphaerales bacterium]|nr:hypothetical protein [Phycisphaerales bacterium]
MNKHVFGLGRSFLLGAGLACVTVWSGSSGQTPGAPVAVREVPRAGNVEPAVVQVIDGKPTAVPRASWTRAWATYTLAPLPVGNEGGYKDLMSGGAFSIWSYFDRRTPEPDETNWSPFNLGLLESALPGDFMPVGPTIDQDSVALRPAIGGGEPTGWNGLGRATLHGAVDLVTGVPLVQVTDLVLPVGGAEFRLNRTRSANRLRTGKTVITEVGVSPAESRWWDWVGTGWMMSENPILLIDSRLPDVVGDSEPRTTLWLDALHSIPFDWVNTKEEAAEAGKPFRRSYGLYDAAPRYRAKLRALKNNVASDQYSHPQSPRRIGAEIQSPGQPAAGDWMPGYYPDRYEVSLYDGALIYEFEPEWEDVPSWQYWYPPVAQRTTAPIHEQVRYSSVHGRPLLPSSSDSTVHPSASQSLATQLFNPWFPTPQNENAVAGRTGRGVGMPYYALLKSIRDRQGNRVEIEYADVLEWNDQGKRIQQTSMKGAVSRVKVFAAGETTPTWTLLYAYRLIPRAGDPVAGPSDGVAWTSPVPSAGAATYIARQWNGYSAAKKYVWSDPALESIYVFEGNVENRRITLMRPPEESLWAEDAVAPRRWPTDTDDLLLRYQSGEHATLALSQSGPPGPPGGNDIKHRADWKFRVRYSYASTDQPNGHSIDATGIVIPSSPLERYHGVRYMPALVRTETQMRASGENAGLRSLQNHVFQYEPKAPFGSGRWLHSVFDDAGLKRIHTDVRANAPATLEATIQELAAGKTGAGINAASSMGFAAGRSAKDFRDAAKWWFGNSGFGGTSLFWSVEGDSLISYV